MSKRVKKRNKPYINPDSTTRPSVTRYSAKVRSPLGEWFHEHQRRNKIIAIATAITLGVGYLLYEFVAMVF